MKLDNFELKTDLYGLILRPHRYSDSAFMKLLNSDPEVLKFTPDSPLNDKHIVKEIITSLRLQFVEKRMGRFIVELPDSKHCIGWCGLKYLEDTCEVDLGFRFLRDFWGKGYATDSAKACLKYGFEELNLQRITAKVLPQNTASISVLKKIGMTKIGTSYEDEMLYEHFEIKKS